MKIAGVIAALLLLPACDGEGRLQQESASEQINALASTDGDNQAERLEAAERRGEALAKETIARDAKATGASDNSVIPPMD